MASTISRLRNLSGIHGSGSPSDEFKTIDDIEYADQLAGVLNRVILKGEFLQDVITAHGNKLLFDEKKRDGWKEERQLPLTPPDPASFQSRRLGRIVIDWVLADKTRGAIKAKYLNTVQVCRRLFDQIDAEVIRFDKVKVFGFPEHSPRCANAVLQTLWLRGIPAETSKSASQKAILVIDIHNPDREFGLVKDTQEPTRLNRACGLEPIDWQWHSDTAQEWCRSLRDWRRHERIDEDSPL